MNTTLEAKKLNIKASAYESFNREIQKITLQTNTFIDIIDSLPEKLYALHYAEIFKFFEEARIKCPYGNSFYNEIVEILTDDGWECTNLSDLNDDQLKDSGRIVRYFNKSWDSTFHRITVVFDASLPESACVLREIGKETHSYTSTVYEVVCAEGAQESINVKTITRREEVND